MRLKVQEIFKNSTSFSQKCSKYHFYRVHDMTLIRFTLKHVYIRAIAITKPISIKFILFASRFNSFRLIIHIWWRKKWNRMVYAIFKSDPISKFVRGISELYPMSGSKYQCCGANIENVINPSRQIEWNV